LPVRLGPPNAAKFNTIVAAAPIRNGAITQSHCARGIGFRRNATKAIHASALTVIPSPIGTWLMWKAIPAAAISVLTAVTPALNLS